MTEQEWLDCTEPHPMLEFVGAKTSGRKMRLFSIACCRRIWHLLSDERSRKMVEVAEQYADGTCGLSDLKDASRKAYDAWTEVFFRPSKNNDSAGALACIFLGSNKPHAVADNAGFYAANAACDLGELDDIENVFRGPELKAQAALLRDVCGNPFQTVPKIDRTWSDGIVRRMAESIYQEGAFDRLHILAAALKNAGCNNAELMRHCRSEGPHVRGCWSLDLILGNS